MSESCQGGHSGWSRKDDTPRLTNRKVRRFRATNTDPGRKNKITQWLD